MAIFALSSVHKPYLFSNDIFVFLQFVNDIIITTSTETNLTNNCFESPNGGYLGQVGTYYPWANRSKASSKTKNCDFCSANNWAFDPATSTFLYFHRNSSVLWKEGCQVTEWTEQMDHTKMSSVRNIDANKPFRLCVQVWCIKAGIHYMTFTQICCPKLQSRRVGIVVESQSQSADFWRSDLIDFTDSNFLSLKLWIHPAWGYQTCIMFWDDFRTHIVFICHVFPSNEACVSAWVCCVWNNVKVWKCVIFRCLLYDA